MNSLATVTDIPMPKFEQIKFLQACVDENSEALRQKLNRAGFSMALAEKFLPAIASCISPLQEDPQRTAAILELISDNPAQLLDRINSRKLARKLNITPGLVTYGMDVIQPLLSDIMARKKDRIVDVVIALAWESEGRLSDPGKNIFHTDPVNQSSFGENTCQKASSPSKASDRNTRKS